MKVLLYDLETAPALGWFWPDRHLYEKNIIEVEQDGFILGFAYKWAHESTVHWVDMFDFPDAKSQFLDLPRGRVYFNNLGVVKKLFELKGEADFSIAHNGKSFDDKVSNLEFMRHRLGPPDNPKSYDTKNEWNRYFRGPSAKLDEIARYLDLGRKLSHEGKKMWFDHIAARKTKMGAYAKQDVALLEQVWNLLKPWVKAPPNWNLDGDRPACCPACGSARFKPTQPDWGVSGLSGRQKYRCLNMSAQGGVPCRHVWRGEVIKRITTTHWKREEKHPLAKRVGRPRRA